MLIESLEARQLYSASFQQKDFVDVIDNPFLPFKAGSLYVYRGTLNGQLEKDVVQVTNHHRKVFGVRTIEVSDKVYIRGQLAEETTDYYAQDKKGNVWYFGEDSAEIEDNKVVTTEGSWLAGRHGATPGIIMLAHPTVGKDYAQEHAGDVAQDRGTVLSLKGKAKTPFGNFSNLLVTKDYSPIEPDSIDHKFFAAGIGEVQEISVAGDSEILKLVTYRP